MKTNEKASFQVLKIAIVTVILMITCSVAVLAFNTELNSVKIVLADNYEMNVITTKTKIEDILKENNIVILPDETVFPNQDSQIGEDRTIKVAKGGTMENMVTQIANTDEAITLEQVLGSYATIIEKIEVVKESIPYETITKNTSSVSEKDRINQVVQQGKDGLKEVTYKVKFQNDIEISRTVIKEKIIKKAVNKIVQVTAATSRGEVDRAQEIEQTDTKPKNIKISKNMDLTQRTGLSKEDFKKIIKNLKSDKSKFFYRNADTIYDLCEKYQINEMFFCGLIAAESGWNIAENHRSTHNYISLMYKGELIKYSSEKEGLEVAAQKLHQNYLTKGGKYYNGKTINGVQKRFCPASSTWDDLVYGCMEYVVKTAKTVK